MRFKDSPFVRPAHEIVQCLHVRLTAYQLIMRAIHASLPVHPCTPQKDTDSHRRPQNPHVFQQRSNRFPPRSPVPLPERALPRGSPAPSECQKRPLFHTVIEIRRRARQCAVCKLCHAAGQEHVLPSKGIPPIRHAAAAQGIGDEANSVGKQLECHTNGTRMDVVSIANELGNHILPFAGSPDRARLPVMDRRHGIIEMRQVACTCIKDIAGVVVGAVRMGNRDCAKLACPPGKCCRARQLRRHIHNAKKPLRNVI